MAYIVLFGRYSHDGSSQLVLRTSEQPKGACSTVCGTLSPVVNVSRISMAGLTECYNVVKQIQIGTQ